MLPYLQEIRTGTAREIFLVLARLAMFWTVMQYSRNEHNNWMYQKFSQYQILMDLMFAVRLICENKIRMKKQLYGTYRYIHTYHSCWNWETKILFF